MIGLVSIAFVLRKLLTKKGAANFAVIIFAMLVSGLVATFSTQPGYLGPSFRRYLQFASSLLLFFAAVNYYLELDVEKQKNRIEMLFSLLITMIIIQIFIGSLIYFFPPFSEYLSLFTTRTETAIVSPVTTEGFKRLTCLIAGGENLGEILAVISPIVLYKLVKTGRVYYHILLYLLLAGCLLTVTRSSVLLFLAGLITFFFLNRKLVHISTWIIIPYSFLLAFVVAIYWFPDIFDPLTTRFKTVFIEYESSQSLTAALNRRKVWALAFETVLSELNLFGHGMLSIVGGKGGKTVNFHNLYLTVLYQRGIVGFLLFLFFLWKIFWSLLKSLRHTTNNYDICLVTSCLISFFILLINEVKFEFTRHASYQQVIIFLLAVYYLSSQCVGRKSAAKPDTSL
jgi:O-antigen ligase